MLRLRKYFNSSPNITDYWWLFCLLSVLTILFHYITLNVPILSLLSLACAFVFIAFTITLVVFKLSDRQKVYIVPKMSKTALKRAIKVRKKFNKSVIAEHLKMGITKRNGVMLPSISVWVSEKLDNGAVFIENLGSFEKLDKTLILQSISGILPSPYEAVSSSLEIGGSFVRFNFEDSETSHRFIIKNRDLKPFINKKDVHSLRLADDLIWNARKVPHASCIGRSGSGKTMFVGGYMAAVAHLQGWKVVYGSAKPDRYTRIYDGPTTPQLITEEAERLVEIMKSRLKKIQMENVDDYGDIDDMCDIAFFIDEIGHLNAMLESDKKLKLRFENAIKSLSFTGRSSGIHMCAISQGSTIEAFLPSAVRGNMKDVVFIIGNAANSGDDRRLLIPGYELPNRNYKQGQGIAMVLDAGKKWETPHYFEAPLFE